MTDSEALYYTLDPKTHEVIPATDVRAWAAAFEWSERDVRRTFYDEVMISTVFLGLNHRFGDGPPLVFETMIFGGPANEYQMRYSTWDEAVEGHMAAVLYARSVHTPWRRAKAWVTNSRTWRKCSFTWHTLRYNVKTKIEAALKWLYG